MARAIFQSEVVDNAGNAVDAATIRVTQEPGGTQVVSLFSDRAGVTVLANPFTLAAGVSAFSFYAAGGAYRVDITKGAFTKTLRYVAIGTAGEQDASAFAGGPTTWFGNTTGTNAYVVSNNGFLPATWENGTRVRCRIVTANTAASTLNPGDLGAKAIVLPGNKALSGGELPAGHLATFDYDSNYDAAILLNPASAVNNWVKGSDIASAAALTPTATGNYFDVTGITTITSIASVAVSPLKLHFDGALTLTHNATDLILPGGANITTAAGDEAEFIEYAPGDWRCTNYQVAAIAPGGGVFKKSYTSSNIAVVAAAGASLSHGLGQIPRSVSVFLECITAEFGYAVGDRVQFDSLYHGPSTVQGVTVAATATQLKYRFGTANPTFGGHNLTTGVLINRTNANWEMVLEAFA